MIEIYRPLTRLTYGVTALLTLLGLVAAGEFLLAYRILGLLAEAADSAEEAFPALAAKVEPLVFYASELSWVRLVSAVLWAGLFLIWLYRAVQNEKAFKSRLRFSPWGAVASFGLPLANLILPPLVWQELLSASESPVEGPDHPAGRLGTWLRVAAWWVSVVLVGMAFFLRLSLAAQSGPQGALIAQWLLLTLGYDGLWWIFLVQTWMLVRKVLANQEMRYLKLTLVRERDARAKHRFPGRE